LVQINLKSGEFMSSVLALVSHLCGLVSHAMRPMLMARATIDVLICWLICWPIWLLLLVACGSPDVSPPVSPTVITLPDLINEPKPVEPVDGVLEIGTGDNRPTLTVQAFYDADKNDLRGPEEVALERAGLRLTPVIAGEAGFEKTGPGRIVRANKAGVLLARVPPGLYNLEFVNVRSPGDDPNAALWALTAAEGVEIKDQNQSLDLPAFCLVETIIQPGPVGVCTPEYDLKPRAFLAATPTEIQAGQTSILSYRADDEAVVTLEPFGVVDSFVTRGFLERSIEPQVTTTYTLRAKNAYGTQEIPIMVKVTP
jgi:hypothetical protein